MYLTVFSVFSRGAELTCYHAADIQHAAQLVTSTSKLNITILISVFHFCFITVYVAQDGLKLIILFSQCMLGLQESTIIHTHTLFKVELGTEPRALGMAGKCSTPEHFTTSPALLTLTFGNTTICHWNYKAAG